MKPVKYCFTTLSDQFADSMDQGLVEVQAFNYGTWTHPVYGKIEITPEAGQRMKENFDNNIVEIELGTDFEHGLDASKGTKASGWIKKVDARDDGIFFGIEFTEEAKKEIKDGQWRYFSAEWYKEWMHPQKGDIHEFVVTGGGLTNKPWIVGMMPVNLSELVVERTSLNEDAAGETQGGGPPDPLKTDKGKEPGTVGDTVDQPEPEPRNERKEGTVDEAKIRELLGIGESDDIEAKITEMASELTPLRAMRETVEASTKFSQQFPEQAERLKQLEATDRENAAIKFAARYSNLPKPTNEDGSEVSNVGPRAFSTVATDKIKDFALKLSQREATATEFADVLDTIANNGIVELGERGSTGHGTQIDEVPATGAAVKFTDKVSEIVESDKITFNAAIAIAAKKHPELAKAYNDEVRAVRS